MLPDLEVTVTREGPRARIVVAERRRLRARAADPARVFAFEWLLRLLHGLACWLALLVTAYRAAGRLARHYDAIPSRAAALRGFQVAIPILFISFFHKAFLTFHLPYQMLLLLVLGYLGYWQMRARGNDAAPAPGHSDAAVASQAS